MNTSQPSDPAPTADEVRAELQRVLAAQMSSFLTYVVEETLAGRGGHLKGYNVAVEALGRGADFDPVADPIVRVEANRLRRALDAHYSGEGAASPLRIVLERGSYMPRFVRADAGAAVTPAPENGRADAGALPEAAVPGQPGGSAAPIPAVPGGAAGRAGIGGWIGAALIMLVGVGIAALSLRLTQPLPPPPASPQSTAAPGREAGAPPSAATGHAVTMAGSAGMSEVSLPLVRIVPIGGDTEREKAANAQFALMLSDALARFDEFVVIEGQRAVTPPAGGQPAYVIEHRARETGGSIFASIRLIEAASGRVVWSASLEEEQRSLDSLHDIREVARRVAVKLAQPYGVLHAELRERGDLGPVLRCLIDTYDYWRKPTEARHAEMRGCLERTVRDNPNFHQAWSLLAMLTLDEHRIGFNPRPDSALTRARAAARTANELAPESARAAQALMAVMTVEGDIEAGIRVGYQAVRRNPFDTDILADLGARLAQGGRALEGRPLLLRAADVNLTRPAWHDFYLFLTARFAGDREAMRAALQSLSGSEAPLALLAQVIATSDTGRLEEGRRVSQRLAMISPVYAQSPAQFLDRAHFAPGVRADMLEAIAQVIGGENALTAPASLP